MQGCLQGWELLSCYLSSLIDENAIDVHLCCLRQYWPLATVAQLRVKLIKRESFLEF